MIFDLWLSIRILEIKFQDSTDLIPVKLYIWELLLHNLFKL